MHLAQKFKKDMSETEGSLHSFTTVYLSVNLFLCMLLMIHYFLNLRIHVFHQFGNILRKKKKKYLQIVPLSQSLLSLSGTPVICVLYHLMIFFMSLISFSYFPSPSFAPSS